MCMHIYQTILKICLERQIMNYVVYHYDRGYGKF